MESYVAGLQSVQSRSRNTLRKSFSNVCETASSVRSLSGTTSLPLTADPGAGSSTLSQAGSLVRTSPEQGKGRALKELGPAYGERWPVSWVRFDLATFSWKTRQCSLLRGSDVFSGTWPQWGTMRGGECWEHDTPEHPTDATGSGSWLATPTATANQLSPSMRKHPGCRRWVPTPVTNGLDGGARARRNPHYVATKGLDPQFPEYLMGWPIGWTDLRPWETDRYLSAWLSRGEYWGAGDEQG